MRSRSSGWSITQCPINRLQGFSSNGRINSSKLDRAISVSRWRSLPCCPKMLPEREGVRTQGDLNLFCGSQESGLGLDHRGQQRRGAGGIVLPGAVAADDQNHRPPVDCCRDSPALLSPSDLPPRHQRCHPQVHQHLFGFIRAHVRLTQQPLAR